MRGPKPQVRYWPSRGSWTDEDGLTHTGSWCCWYRGKQRTLAAGPDDSPDGPTYKSALKAWLDLLDLSKADTAKDGNTIRVVCEKYLRHIEAKRRPGTLYIRQNSLKHFVASFGEKKVRDLNQDAVNGWLDSMRQPRQHARDKRRVCWTEGSIRCACTSIQACLNWAVKTGLTNTNPLKGLEQPAARSRGRAALIGRDHAKRVESHRRILERCSPTLRKLVVVLEATGARPGELIGATAKDFDASLGAIVYHADDKRHKSEFRHKTAGKGKDRIIFLSGEALAIVRQAAEENGIGPIFRTRTGKPWTRSVLNFRFHVIRKLLGLPNLTAYSYRHGFATSWLEQGKSVDILAELLGNSPAVIRKHYSHLLSDTANLRRQIEAFHAERTGTAGNRLDTADASPAS